MTNYFQHSAKSPYHISVGAVLVNSKNEIAHHYFSQYGGFKDLYLLMRETMHVREKLEDTLHRGLMEEFGATAKVEAYLGSQVVIVKDKHEWQKTTLYFLCRLKKWDPKLRDPDDDEKDSQIQWHAPDQLIKLMQKHRKQVSAYMLDESDIIKRALEYLKT